MNEQKSDKRKPGARGIRPKRILQAGEVLQSRYMICERLGSGGMGEIFKVVDLQDGNKLKAIKHLFDCEKTAVARFEREYHFLRQVEHPHLIKAHDFFETDSHFFLVLDWVEGRSMQSILQGDPVFSLPERLAIANKIARGTEVLHLAGIVHRDIKPGNILIDPETCRVTLLDLGIAKEIDPGKHVRLTRSGAVLGTTAYMSPEQANGEALGPESDVFSLGVTLYQFFLWEKKSPFWDDSPISVMFKIATYNPPPLYESILEKYSQGGKTLAQNELEAYRSLSSCLEMALNKESSGRWENGGVFADLCENIYHQFMEIPSYRNSVLNLPLSTLSPRPGEQVRRAVRSFSQGRSGPSATRPKKRANKEIARRWGTNALVKKIVALLGMIFFLLLSIFFWRALGSKPGSSPLIREKAAHEQESVAYFQKGANLANRGEIEGAIAEYTRAIVLSPLYSEAYLYRGAALYHKKDLKGALSDYDEAERLGSQNPFLYINRGILYTENQEFEKALADFGKALSMNPKEPLAYGSRANLFGKQGKFEEGLRDYDRAIALDPKNSPFYVNRGILKSKAKDMGGAIHDYSQAIRLDPKNTEAYLNRGLALTHQKEFEKATRDFNRAILLDPNEADAYFYRGVVKANRGNEEGAAFDYDRAIELKPGAAEPYYYRGNVFKRKNDLDAAIRYYTLAIERNPAYLDAYEQRGGCWKSKKEEEKAIRDYSRVLEMNPSRLEVWLSRADLREDKKEFDGALQDYARALEIDPKHEGLYWGMAKLWWKKGNYREAISSLKKYLELQIEAPHAYACLLLFNAARRAGDRKGMALALRKPAESGPDNFGPSLLRYYAGEISEKELFLEASREGTKKRGRLCEFYYYVGIDYLIRGDRAKAKRYLGLCLEHEVHNFVEPSMAEIELQRMEKE